MTDPMIPDLAITAAALVCSGLVLGVGLLAARHWRARSSVAYLIVKLVIFSCLTALIMARKVVPYRPIPTLGSSADRVVNGCLDIVWWLIAAGVAVGFMRVFVVLGQKPRESKLMQEILAALVYIAVTFAIIANVFELPVKVLLATSGAVAIILGLALQSSLGDVFSGIVLDLERPYHVGDWIIVDDGVRGAVIETNWRSTHILTVNNDIAVLPNSVIAKAKLINCSAPTRAHGASLRIRLDASRAPSAGCDLLREVLLGSDHIAHSPEPAVTVQQLDADSIEYELSFCVADVADLGEAQNDILDRVFQAAAAVGRKIAPRVGAVASPLSGGEADLAVPDRLLSGVSLFATLTEVEKTALASQMRRKDYKSGEVVVPEGTVLNSLSIIKDGVMLANEKVAGSSIERLRLTPGVYFGETGVLTGKATAVELVALTHVTVYEIAKEALVTLLKARPAMADELGAVLAYRQLLRHSATDLEQPGDRDAKGLVRRLAEEIQRLFALH
jgi:small-conductance mechanosensitive channel/CRP-like cAMP-binding protein